MYTSLATYLLTTQLIYTYAYTMLYMRNVHRTRGGKCKLNLVHLPHFICACALTNGI